MDILFRVFVINRCKNARRFDVRARTMLSYYFVLSSTLGEQARTRFAEAKQSAYVIMRNLGRDSV